MSLQLTPEIAAKVQRFLAEGRFKNEEEVLREALAALKRREEDLADIHEGIADMEAGRGRPLEEIDKEIRAKFGINKTE